MISFQQFRRFFLNLSLTTILVTAIAFSFSSEQSWATVPLNSLISQQPIQIANSNRAKAMSKDRQFKSEVHKL